MIQSLDVFGVFQFIKLTPEKNCPVTAWTVHIFKMFWNPHRQRQRFVPGIQTQPGSLGKVYGKILFVGKISSDDGGCGCGVVVVDVDVDVVVVVAGVVVVVVVLVLLDLLEILKVSIYLGKAYAALSMWSSGRKSLHLIRRNKNGWSERQTTASTQQLYKTPDMFGGHLRIFGYVRRIFFQWLWYQQAT